MMMNVNVPDAALEQAIAALRSAWEFVNSNSPTQAHVPEKLVEDVAAAEAALRDAKDKMPRAGVAGDGDPAEILIGGRRMFVVDVSGMDAEEALRQLRMFKAAGAVPVTVTAPEEEIDQGSDEVKPPVMAEDLRIRCLSDADLLSEFAGPEILLRFMTASWGRNDEVKPAVFRWVQDRIRVYVAEFARRGAAHCGIALTESARVDLKRFGVD